MATDAELVHFIRQFSVFSNQFLVAALLAGDQCPDACSRRGRPRRFS